MAAVVSAVIFIGMGLVLLQRDSFAWGFFPLAASVLFIVGYQIHLARLPLPDFDEDGAPGHEDDSVDPAR